MRSSLKLIRSVRGRRFPRSRVGRGMRWASASIGLLLLALGVGVASAPAAAYQRTDVSNKIMCLCGCNAVLEECPHQDCSWGIPAKNLITEDLAKGETPNQIIKYFVATYGEKVLAAPSKSGFNALAWITPFIVLIVGAVAVYAVARTWSRGRGGGEGGEAAVVLAAPAETAVPEEIARKLEDELKDFD
jgi:cytochrome c-type biogenesis protein CcmH/NrfF